MEEHECVPVLLYYDWELGSLLPKGLRFMWSKTVIWKDMTCCPYPYRSVPNEPTLWSQSLVSEVIIVTLPKNHLLHYLNMDEKQPTRYILRFCERLQCYVGLTVIHQDASALAFVRNNISVFETD